MVTQVNRHLKVFTLLSSPAIQKTLTPCNRSNIYGRTWSSSSSVYGSINL